MTKTFAAQIAEIRTAAQLVAYVNADSDDLPRPEVDVTDPIESRAVRALSVVPALIPYVEEAESDGNFESAISDLVGDLRHLADHLGVDWDAVDRRAAKYYREELALTTDGCLADANDGRTAPALELVVVRDPDGGTEVDAFLDGEPIIGTEYTIDAGAGADWDGWKSTRDENLAAASPNVRSALIAAYDDPPGGQYIEGRENEPWI